jgi:hypothetical protein
MAVWTSLAIHLGPVAAGIAVSGWALRRSSDALLRFLAGLVAIFGRDQRSHTERALEVLYATVKGGKSPESDGRA